MNTSIKKYIQRNAQGLPGNVWHSDPKCNAIKPDNKVIVAPESLLKSYQITQKCQLCIAREERERLRDKEEDLRSVQYVLVLASDVLSKSIERDYLRKQLKLRSIHYSLRESKNRLARKYFRCLLRSKDYTSILNYTESAIRHWSERIEVKDRHKPDYYRRMLERSIHLKNLVLPLL